MPRLSTPRIVPTSSVMFLPGMKVPGGANTLFMPVRAFGAPHTTCTGSPDAGVDHADPQAVGVRVLLAPRRPARRVKARARLSRRPRPRARPVSVSTIRRAPTAVSRWSLSQERVNFMRPQRVACASRRWLLEPATKGELHGSRPARPTARPNRRRQVERPEAVVVEPAHVRLEEGAQVRHAVFQHGDAVDADAPGEALVDVGVEAAVAQHVRMHHAAAEDLEPVVALAEADLAALARALDVDLGRGLGEREEATAGSAS